VFCLIRRSAVNTVIFREARDRLEDAVLWLCGFLAVLDRTDLGRVVGLVDADFDRRSAPLSLHLALASPRGACGWWRQRLSGN
jgi:hypothetical protein